MRLVALLLICIPAYAGEFSGAGANGGGGEWPQQTDVLTSQDLNRDMLKIIDGINSISARFEG